MSAWSIVLPQAADVTNLVGNPSAELATTGYTGITNTPARTAAQQRRGAWSISYAMASGVNDGLYFGTVSLTNGVTYGFSVDVKGVAGVSYRIYFGSTAAAVLGTPTTFTATGRWQRVYVAWAENAGASRRLYITKNNSANTGTIYVDGLLCWAGAYDLLYFDGDSRGFRDGDFYWTGTPHSSAAIMRAGTRAGGQVVDMNTLGFYIRQVLGLGLAGLLNVGMATPLIGGGQYQRTIVEPRSFALAGSVHGATRQGLQQNRRSLINAVKPDATPAQQPLLLRYQATENGAAYGEPLDIPAVFKDGLQGGELAGPAENLALRFDTYMPFIAWEDGHEGASLAYQATIASADYLIASLAGAWQKPYTTPPNSRIEHITLGQDKVLWTGGNYTAIDGVAANYLAYRNAGAWAQPGAGVGGQVWSVSAVDVNTVYTSYGVLVRRWISPTWTTLHTGNGDVRKVIRGPDGNLYICGGFTSLGGTAANRVARSNFSAVTALGGGISDYVYDIAFGPDGLLYAAAGYLGVFKFTGSTWVQVGSVVNVNRIAFLADGTLVGAATSTSAAIYKFNGFAWVQIGTAAGGYIYAIAPAAAGFYIVGSLTSINGISMPGRAGFYTGSAWVPVDFYFSGGSGTTLYTVAVDRGDLYFGGDITGTVTAAALTTLANTGTHDAFPTFRLTGPGTVYSLKNHTTGDAIYFNLTLQTGEVAYLDLTPGAIRFYSNFRSNLLGAILPGSDLATWRLVKGANNVGLFIGGTTDGNTAAWVYWRKAHHSIDGAAN